MLMTNFSTTITLSLCINCIYGWDKIVKMVEDLIKSVSHVSTLASYIHMYMYQSGFGDIFTHENLKMNYMYA